MYGMGTCEVGKSGSTTNRTLDTCVRATGIMSERAPLRGRDLRRIR